MTTEKIISKHRSYVGPAENYDIASSMQFNLLTNLGLNEHHTLLDIGCGSLRAGRLFIPYLLPNNYFGLEPNKWLVNAGFQKELGKDIIDLKHPQFSHETDFSLSKFKKKFDFILAQSIFSHASSSQIEKCITEASRVMKPESVFAFTFYKAVKNYEGESWSYPENVYYRLDFILQLLKEVGLFGQNIEWPHPYGQTWVLATYEKKEFFISLEKGLGVYKIQLKELETRFFNLYNHPWVKLGKFIRKKLFFFI